MDDFVIETRDGLDGQIEKSDYFDISAKNPAKIAFAQLKPVTTSNKVLEESELLLDFEMPLPLQSGC